MASSINGLPVAIQSGSLKEGCKFQGVDVDVKLGVAGHQRQHFSFGSADTWSFICLENADAIAWVESVGCQMVPILTSGIPVILVADYGTVHSLPAGQLVYVLGVHVWYDKALTTRYVGLTVRGV